ncbi:hypothetical protein [Emticicia sp. SJ17W-69]
MKTAKVLTPKVTINPKLKSNPSDPFIQKKIEKATALLNSLKKPIQF